MKTQRKHRERDEHSRDANQQQRSSTSAIDQKHRDNCHPEIYNADAGGGEDRAGCRRETGGLKYFRRVINHGVNAGDLLEDCESESNHQGGSNMSMKQVGPSPALFLLRQARLNLGDLKIDIGALANPHQHATRDLVLTTANEPARSFGKKKHS